MNIFGLYITTKKKHFESLAQHEAELQKLNNELDELADTYYEMMEAFPFYLGQTVYDVALKNAKGRYTKTHPSFEHSTITEVVVDEKNYFNLVKRLNNSDVFFDRETAETWLKYICG